MADPAAARWPKARTDRGHYESYYLRAVDPARPRGVWIRYTVTRPAGSPPEGQLWCTFFDREHDRVCALRVPAGEPATGPGEWIRLADSIFGTGQANGAIGSREGTARWSLRWRTGGEPLRHLPRDWMYSRPFPRTKLLSPSPATVFDGSLEVDGEHIAVDDWPGMVGHNWGEQHAEQWIWLHGLGFAGAAAGTWVDLAVARVRIGPLTTPWVANGAVSLDGVRVPVGGLGRRVRVVATPTACRLQVAGPGLHVGAEASAPPSAFVEWNYANPDGSARRVVNCSVADLTLRVARSGRESVELSAPGRAAYEFGRPAG